MHASGVHATVAGVLLGLVVPVKPRASVPSISTHDRTTDVAHRFEHLMRPISAGIAVPVFAFFASGVRVVDGGLRAGPAATPSRSGVIAGLVIGKLVGVFGSTYLVARFTRARLDDDLAWRDVGGLAMLTGVGFTVSLLVGELAFGVGSERDDSVKLAVLVGSLLVRPARLGRCCASATAVYRRIAELESRDDDADGIPDVYEREAT